VGEEPAGFVGPAWVCTGREARCASVNGDAGEGAVRALAWTMTTKWPRRGALGQAAAESRASMEPSAEGMMLRISGKFGHTGR